MKINQGLLYINEKCTSYIYIYSYQDTEYNRNFNQDNSKPWN